MYNTIQYNTISHLRFVTFYICALEMLLLSYLLIYLLTYLLTCNNTISTANVQTAQPLVSNFSGK